jgi:hypothetical protein
MSTETFLAPSVHAVRIMDDIVFLDAAADQYLCWPSADGVSLSDDRRRLTISDPNAVLDLESTGLASRREYAQVSRYMPAAPAADLWPERNSTANSDDWRNLLRASCDATLVYPRRTFAELVAFGAARGPHSTPDSEPGLEMSRLVAGFHRWAYWTPAPAKCLIRSFILLRLLRRHGLDARWVFAVRTWPFEAHCWLQAGSTVLDDARDRLVAYHPILVV